MARARIKSRKASGVALHIDNAQPLGAPRSPKSLPEPGQDAEAHDYPATVSRPGGKKNRTSPSIVTRGKGIK